VIYYKAMIEDIGLRNFFPILLVLFLLGLFIGSFLNVVTVRYNTGRSMVTGRSMCFSCGKTLKWYELVPVISFVLQGGRCHGCKSRISWQYPAVEFLTGMLFALVWVFVPVAQADPLALAYYLIMMALLVAITVYDLKHQIIPDAFVYAFAALALGYFVLNTENFDAILSIPALYTLLAGPFLALPFAALWLVSKGRWIGLGDAKLALGIGWFLGLPLGGSAIILSFWVGAAVGLLLIAASHAHAHITHAKTFSLKSEIPFGPFMILGMLAVLFSGLNVFDLGGLFPMPF